MKYSRVVRSSAFALGLAGCSQPAGESKVEPPAAVVLASPAPASPPAAAPRPQPPAPQPAPKPEPPPPAFAFPADRTGTALARVVAPDVTRPLPAERFGAAPKPRTVPARVLEPDAPATTSHTLPPLLPPKPAPAKPGAPPEKVPLVLGALADGGPARPVLPVAAVVTERARDTNLPPPAPVLGRPLNDRASLDDPTGELGNAEVVAGVVKVPPAPSGFVKVAVPDPFELGEQVKPKVPAAAEPSAAPVTVNPQRVK
ncbi:MAG: hypothetical protein J0I06_06660 [Planctomycetes bacterium]|nr:hypothetical protein [Planctomycetota bacterium]